MRCDRCGATIDYAHPRLDARLVSKDGGALRIAGGLYRLDLCRRCYAELCDWLATGVPGGAESRVRIDSVAPEGHTRMEYDGWCLVEVNDDAID